MNLETADRIAKAVLYEGYMLYPYRPSSVKNRQRWNFGVLCPRAYSEAQGGSDAWAMHTECLIEGNSITQLEVRVRFLQLVARSVGKVNAPAKELRKGLIPEFHPVERLELNDRIYEPWQEAVEREVGLPACNLQGLGRGPMSQAIMFPAEQQVELLRDSGGLIAAVIVRQREAMFGLIEVKAEQVAPQVFKVSAHICNTTPFAVSGATTRDEALLRSLVSVHTVLGVQDGRFVSLLAPEGQFVELAAYCENVGAWPVLVGEEGQCDTMLASPIILYDYPKIAPESAGDLFDGTEIDEILSLRILTLTDEEKRELSHSDERARAMLERTETLPAEHWMKLHGALRGLRPLKEEAR